MLHSILSLPKVKVSVWAYQNSTRSKLFRNVDAYSQIGQTIIKSQRIWRRTLNNQAVLYSFSFSCSLDSAWHSMFLQINIFDNFIECKKQTHFTCITHKVVVAEYRINIMSRIYLHTHMPYNTNRFLRISVFINMQIKLLLQRPALSHDTPQPNMCVQHCCTY